MNANLTPWKAAPLLRVRGGGLRLCIRPIAFGNALGGAIADGLRPAPDQSAAETARLNGYENAAAASERANLPTGTNGYRGGYDPADLVRAGFPRSAQFFETPTDRDGNAIPGVAQSDAVQRVEVPARRFDPRKDSFLFNGPTGNGFSLDGGTLANGNAVEVYANGYSVTDPNGNATFNTGDTSESNLTGKIYGYASERNNFLNGKYDPNSFIDHVASVFTGGLDNPDTVLSDRERTEKTTLAGLLNYQVQATVNPDKFSPLLQRLDNLEGSLLAGAAYVGAGALGYNQATQDQAAALGNAAGNIAFARATAINGGPAFTGAVGKPEIETQSPYAFTSADYLAQRATTDKLQLGIKFESIQGNLDNFQQFNNRSADQLYVRAFDGNGGLLPGSVRLDRVGLNADDSHTFIDYKLSTNSPLTKNQQIHYPAFEQYGGLVTGLRGADINLPKGRIIPPFKVNIVPGPIPTIRRGN
jgi:hypothetical protein